MLFRCDIAFTDFVTYWREVTIATLAFKTTKGIGNFGLILLNLDDLFLTEPNSFLETWPRTHLTSMNQQKWAKNLVKSSFCTCMDKKLYSRA